jgi:hypothetical protein
MLCQMNKIHVELAAIYETYEQSIPEVKYFRPLVRLIFVLKCRAWRNTLGISVLLVLFTVDNILSLELGQIDFRIVIHIL